MKQRSGKKTNPRTRCLGYKLDKLSLVPVSSGVEEARELCTTASSEDVEILSEQRTVESYIHTTEKITKLFTIKMWK